MSNKPVSAFEKIEKATLRKDVLDMWHLYQKLSASDPEALEELTFYDTISAREGLLFPDFFKAVYTFLKEQKKCSRSSLEAELEQTFSVMHNNEPFFNRHPELRYLKRLSLFNGELNEIDEKFRELRLPSDLLWSLSDYHKFRGNLNKYVSLDEELVKQQSIGTLFEKDGGSSPGVVLVYLQPDNDEIVPYLRSLKHGNIIGFGSLALAEIEGKTFVAVTSLQTDLLRRDHVEGKPHSWYYNIVKNEGSKYTVPANIRRPFLENYAWAHKILGAVEAATLSTKTGISGVIIPTTSFGLLDEELAEEATDEERNILEKKPLEIQGKYAQGVYDFMPEKRGYSREDVTVSFPFTKQSGRGACWAATIDKLHEILY